MFHRLVVSALSGPARTARPRTRDEAPGEPRPPGADVAREGHACAIPERDAPEAPGFYHLAAVEANLAALLRTNFGAS